MEDKLKESILAGITVGILLTNQIESEKTLYSILKKLTLNKRIDFLSASVYNQEQDESISINTVSKWLEISHKSNNYHPSEFICEGNHIRVYSIKIDEKMGLEIYFPYDFFNELYSLEEKKIEFLKPQMLDLMKSNTIDYLFIDFDENLELSLLDFKHKMMHEVCYYILAIIKDEDKFLEFSSGEIL